MLKSMTAYSRAQKSNEFGDIIIEMRSVNHRYLEASLRLPEDFKSQEAEYKKRIASYAQRGKVDLSLRYVLNQTQNTSININNDMVESLMDAEKQVLTIAQAAQGLKVADILQWPGVIAESKKDASPLFDLASETLESALKEFVNGREKEGSAIAEMIVTRCDEMSIIIKQIEKQRPNVINAIEEKWRQTLQEKISSWADGIETGRLEQEMAIIAQKLDVDEEIDRLNTHLKEIKSVLQRHEPVGRRLDFLMQELNRETNTLSSKSQDSQTTQLTIDLKVLIEQMREQIQNIE